MDGSLAGRLVSMERFRRPEKGVNGVMGGMAQKEFQKPMNDDTDTSPSALWLH
jgi:hypothetical protein